MERILKLNKIFVGVFLTVLTIFALTVTSFADEINLIDIKVELEDDGSARITQIWDVYTDKGTEFYIPMGNMRDMEILDFKVSDESGRVFDFQNNWDIDASLEQKAYKNGFNYTGGGSFEMCWGKGTYGSHTYTLTYTMTNMVQAFSDYDGFLIRFVNDDMSPSPQKGKIEISRAGAGPGESFVAEETGVFAFGYSGYIDVVDGVIVAESDSSIDPQNHMTLLVRLPKGLLHPVSTGSGTFGELEEKAKEGSDYTNENGSYTDSGSSQSIGKAIKSFLSVSIMSILALFFVIGKGISVTKNAAFPLMAEYKEKAPKYKELDYYRDLPLENSLEATGFALTNAGKTPKDEDIMGAVILQLVKSGAFSVKKDEEARSFFRSREKTSLVLNPEIEITNESEKEFYQIIKSAAGPDGILQEKEMKSYAKKNYKLIQDWLEDMKQSGQEAFGYLGGFEEVQVKKMFGLRWKKKLTDKGLQLINNALGFKKYLEDFTLIAEREAKEVALWDGYLIFAALFGIADKVAEEMKRIYPDFERISEIAGHGQGDLLTTMHMANYMNRAMYTGFNDARSSGGGGSSSLGGGGGFSGGGSGGGSR